MAQIDELLARDASAWRAQVDAAVGTPAAAGVSGTGPAAAEPIELSARRPARRRAAWMGVSVAALVALGAAGGVAGIRHGSGGHPAGGPSAAATTQTEQSTPPSDEPVKTLIPIQYEPAKLLTAQQAAGLTSQPWDLTGTSDGGRVLKIRYAAWGLCASGRGLHVEQTATTVTIAALSKESVIPAGGACVASLPLYFVTVTLDAPLGDRKLVHAPVDPSVARYQH